MSEHDGTPSWPDPTTDQQWDRHPAITPACSPRLTPCCRESHRVHD